MKQYLETLYEKYRYDDETFNYNEEQAYQESDDDKSEDLNYSVNYLTNYI